MTADDCRLLCEKMGMAWKCYGCHDPNCSLRPTFTTVPEREDVMQWAFQQEWWEGVYPFAWCRYHEEQHTSGQCSTLHGYIKWLFQKPAHLPELVLQYGKEVLKWEPKGGSDD